MSSGEDHLRSGQLGTADVTASTVANIGPGIDFYFAFGVIAVTAGVAAPLTIVAAGVAVVFIAFTVAEFTKAEPSAGSFITYVETALGPRAGVATAVLVAVGYIVALAGVFTLSGGMVALTPAHYTSWNPPWEPLTLVLTGGAMWLTVRRVRLSTRAVARPSSRRWGSCSSSACLAAALDRSPPILTIGSLAAAAAAAVVVAIAVNGGGTAPEQLAMVVTGTKLAPAVGGSATRRSRHAVPDPDGDRATRERRSPLVRSARAYRDGSPSTLIGR